MFKPIRRGDKGPTVRAIQNFLRDSPFCHFDIISDGVFGDYTDEAVRQYQREHKLKDDGVIGNATMAIMLGEGLMLFDISDTLPTKPGTITPLVSNAERAKIFGSFKYVSAPTKGNPENIEILGDWEDRNIKMVVVPQLIKLGISTTGRVRVHEKAVTPLLKLWQAWEDQGVLRQVLTYEGAFVPRFIRGSRTTLSNHSFGSAFDINAAWNGLGKVPAKQGKEGCLLDLVPIANSLGWYWGGHFSRADGMHFELSRELALGTFKS